VASGEYQFERFVAAVHRRMVALRGLERVGLCILGGCAATLVLMPILIWRGQGTGELLAVVLGAAAMAGIGWGLAARPTKLAAAMEADRQLGWSDLLGTAWMLRRGVAAEMADMERTVLAMAEARCAGTAASAVVLHRLGVRGWGGIGLAGALVVGVSLFGGDPNRAAAARSATGPRSWQEIEAMQERGNAARTSASADYRRARPGLGGDDDDPSSSTSTTADAASGAAAASEAAKNGAGGAQEGSGAGAGQSASRAGGGNTAKPIAGGDANANSGNAGATSAGGGGTASVNSANGSGRSGSSAGANAARKAAPVWRGDGWPADQEAARVAIQSGRVPDAYREMVRDYFERE
jgi:hypothetical protein